MAYEKQTWNTGDLITAEKLNHAEQGIAANAIFHVVTFTTQDGTTYTCDHTYEEIAALISGGAPLIAIASQVWLPAILMGNDDDHGGYFGFSTLTGVPNGDKIGSLLTVALVIYEDGSVEKRIADRGFT